MDVFSKDAQRAQPSSPEVAYAQLDSAPLCCRDLRELDYQLITEAGSVKVTMGPNMQAFRFATGKSFVKGFELPEFAKDKMKVSVESPVLEMVFMPNVLLLDENYQPVRVYGNDELRFSKRGVASANRYTLDIRIDVDREQALEARYLVLFTTDEQMQSATKLDKKLDTESAERLGSEMQMIKAMRGEYAAHVPAGLVKFNFQYEPSDKQSATKARQVLAETSTEQNKAASVLVATEAATVTPAPQTVVVDNKQPVSQNVSRTGRTIQPETEAMFISLIEQAVANDDLDTALQFVEEAERLGSTKVRGAFIDAFKSR
ncbi:MalM family protein [Aliagarivorans marinus]|uniref:MalM family protein n=1 Tax=Aliagarivorans marinus TaxID=561965 RepID=UPI0012F81ED6|nr:MalM family protein [Aliagarivorans marinus]